MLTVNSTEILPPYLSLKPRIPPSPNSFCVQSETTRNIFDLSFALNCLTLKPVFSPRNLKQLIRTEVTRETRFSLPPHYPQVVGGVARSSGSELCSPHLIITTSRLNGHAVSQHLHLSQCQADVAGRKWLVDRHIDTYLT